MSNISGDTFFIENSVNCSVIGTINGSVSFLDTSSNCGQVLNAIFSGGVNCGQACGCTIFCNSNSYGYVCGTGILRGNSVLYGAADCVIQCDQSRIDGGASVADCEFLITTGLPVNIYSNDSCYYTYLSGSGTISTGAWSNGYYNYGAKENDILGQIGVLALDTIDCAGWYFYSGGSAFLADGNFENASITNGCLNNICSNFPELIKYPSNLNTISYSMYENGISTGLLNGFYAKNNCEIIKLSSSTLNCCIVDGSFSNANSYPFLIENSNLIFNCGDEYIILDCIYVCIVDCTGFYSNGIFGQTTNSYYSICNWCASCGYSVLKLNESIPTPRLAINDNLYYIYCTGVPTLASGLYSNFAINGGIIDCSYFTNMPTSGIDCGCYIYESGVAISLGNVNNYILDNNLYYGSYQYYPFENYCLFPFKSDNTRIGLVAFSDGPQSNINGLIKNSHSFTCQQAGGFSDGCRAFYAEFSNIDSCWGIACVNTNFSCSTPFITEEACFPGAPVIKYYVYCGGIGCAVQGAFTNCWFENSCATTCTILTPVEAQDNLGYYYIYNSGVPSLAPDGAYVNLYVCNGVVAAGYYSCFPLAALDCSGLYIIYCDGIAYMPSGPYSNGYFNCFVINTDFSCLTPLAAQDNCNFYIYCSGIADGSVCNGPYSNYYLINNQINPYTCCTPIETIDQTGYYVNYNNGTAFVVDGAYTNFLFNNGYIRTDVAYSGPSLAIDGDSTTHYVFISGVGCLAADGPYSCAYFVNQQPDYTYLNDTPQQALDNGRFYRYCYGAAPILINGIRNDVPGFNGYPNGIYNFGDYGEYNPNPCFIAWANGPYINTYYCANEPNSALGIVTFDSQYICCGTDQGCVPEPRTAWLYCVNVGIDPTTVYYDTNASFTGSVTTLTCCLTNAGGTECNYTLISNSFVGCYVSINNLFYSCLNPLTPSNACYIFEDYYCCVYQCQILYDNVYCTCYYDVYCTCTYDFYDESINYIVQCTCEVCCGQDSCQVCCGSVPCGSEVVANSSISYYYYVSFACGLIADVSLCCSYTNLMDPTLNTSSCSNECAYFYQKVMAINL